MENRERFSICRRAGRNRAIPTIALSPASGDELGSSRWRYFCRDTAPGRLVRRIVPGGKLMVAGEFGRIAAEAAGRQRLARSRLARVAAAEFGTSGPARRPAADPTNPSGSRGAADLKSKYWAAEAPRFALAAAHGTWSILARRESHRTEKSMDAPRSKSTADKVTDSSEPGAL